MVRFGSAIEFDAGTTISIRIKSMTNPPNTKRLAADFPSKIMTNLNHPSYDPAGFPAELNTDPVYFVEKVGNQLSTEGIMNLYISEQTGDYSSN